MKNKIAVFDIDGTIFRKNLAFELINELAWMKVFKREVRKELVTLYTKWLDHHGTYEEYRKALKIDPTFHYATLKLGQIYIDRGKIDDAKKLVCPIFPTQPLCL